MSRKKVLMSGTGAAVLVSLLLLVSCGQKAPTSPYSPTLPNANLLGAIDTEPLVSNISSTLSAAVSVAYGSSDLSRDRAVPLLSDSIYLYLPAYSVPEPVTISCGIVQGFNTKGELITKLDCGPDGLNFNSNIELRYKSSAKDGTVLKFYWYDEASARWKLDQTRKVRNGWVIFYIKHFSKYTVVDGSTSNGSE